MSDSQSSTPDILMCTSNISPLLQNITLIPDLCSDHLSMQFSFNLTSPPSSVPTLIPIYRECNIDNVTDIMIEFIASNSTLTQNSISQFSKALSSAIQKSTPIISKKSYKYPLPKFILSLLKQKRQLYRDFKETEDRLLKQKFNRLNKDIHKLILDYKTDLWIKACEKVNSLQGRQFWQEIKKLSKYRKTDILQKLRDPITNELATDDRICANILAAHFKQTYSFTSNNNYDDNFLRTVNNWYLTYKNSQAPQTPDDDISEEEYYKHLSKGKNTAPGHDNIHRQILKLLSPPIHEYIITIFNYLYSSQSFPMEWRQGIVICIPKSEKDTTETRNYRPITLLPVLGKLFESIIKDKIMHHISALIPPYQFGFLEHRSTTLPLTILTSNCQTACLEGQKTAIVFLDIEKAFDSVWHLGLLYKCYLLKIPLHLINILDSFLHKRTLHIRVRQSYSNSFTTQQGLPQGSPLSPLLYNILVHDLYNSDPNFLNKSAYPLLYADDTALVAHASTLPKALTTLQGLIDTIQTWFAKWRITINCNKSQLLIPFHRPNTSPFTVTINNLLLRPSNTCKYLGITFDPKFTFKTHSLILKKKLKQRSAYFRSLTYRSQGISLKTAVHIYKMICRPLLEYAAILYLYPHPTTLRNLQVAERSALRVLTKLRHPLNPLHNPPNSLLYEITQIPPIENRLRLLSQKFASAPFNRELLNTLCIHRNPNIMCNRKYPQTSIYEHISNLIT